MIEGGSGVSHTTIAGRIVKTTAAATASITTIASPPARRRVHITGHFTTVSVTSIFITSPVNMDCTASPIDDGRFRVSLAVNHSSVSAAIRRRR